MDSGRNTSIEKNEYELKIHLSGNEIALLGKDELLGLIENDRRKLLYCITTLAKRKISLQRQTRDEFVLSISRLLKAGLSLKSFAALSENDQKIHASHADLIVFLLNLGFEYQQIGALDSQQMAKLKREYKNQLDPNMDSVHNIPLQAVKEFINAILIESKEEENKKMRQVDPACYKNCIGQLTTDELLFFRDNDKLDELISIPENQLVRLVNKIITHRSKDNEEPVLTLSDATSEYLECLDQLLLGQSNISLQKFAEADDNRQDILIKYYNEYAISSRLIDKDKLDQLTNLQLEKLLSSLDSRVHNSKSYTRFCLLTSKSVNRAAEIANLLREVDEMISDKDNQLNKLK